MSSQSQIVLRPVGIVTQPNKLGVYADGALRQADRAYLRNLATLESAFSWVSKAANGSPRDPSFLITTDSKWINQVFWTGSVWAYAWFDLSNATLSTNGNLLNSLGSAAAVDALGRFSYTRSRGRIVVAMNKGTLVWDSDTSASAPRTAGMMPPVISALQCVSAGGTGSQGGALLKATQCHVTALLRRKYADGYEIVSAPAAAQQVYCSATDDQNIELSTILLPGFFMQAGDVLEIYRTRAQAYSGFTGTNTGSDFFLSMKYTTTSADVINGFVTNLVDTTPDSNLADALYTNAGQGGAGAMALPPPTSRIAATFKGHTFYLNRTDPPTFKFRVPVTWGFYGVSATGSLPYYRKNGIGTRSIAGTTTSGNPTITGVSAGDLVGIVIGQKNLLTAPFPAGATVTAIGASTVTFSQNANTNGATVVQVVDVMEVDGVSIAMPDVFSFTAGIANTGMTSTTSRWALMLDRVFPVNGVSSVQPFTVPADYVTVTRLALFETSPAITVRATNGNNYVPRFPRIEAAETAQSFTETVVPNGLSWSEQNQPENCPPLNTAFVGIGTGYAAYPTRDALWIFASDGLWRLSGTGGSAGDGYDWRIDPVDSTLIISGPQAGCVLRDTVYAYTNRGFVSIDSAGNIKELSNGRLNDVLPGPFWSTPTYNAANAIYLMADLTNDEIWLREPNAAGGSASGRVWIYNTITDAFTQDIPAAATTFGSYASFLGSVVVYDLTNQRIAAPSTTARAQLDATFQPLYADNPFNLRHWQQLEVALDCGVSVNVAVTLNGSQGAGTRTAAPGGDSIHSRTSFSIPRNTPAVANNIAVGLSVSSGATVPVKLQGLSLMYRDLTNQRKNR